MKKNKDNSLIEWGQRVIEIEAEALNKQRQKMDTKFVKVVKLLAACKGRIVVTGMGKAGIIGQKFSATLSSTGSSSFWLHAAEAVHGDLGRIKKDDVVFVLSFSGETEEIKNLIPFVKTIGAKIAALTGNKKSQLVRYADAVVFIHIKKEACSLGLAPTTSTTVMLAVCDAVAVCLQRLRGFQPKDFALFHPRGSLGRKLLLRVKDVMRKGKFNPIVTGQTLVKDVLVQITSAHAGAASVVNEAGELIGIFTDGDLRRHLEQDSQLLRRKVANVMTKNPVVVYADDLASEALRILEKKKIDEIPVVDQQMKNVGMLDVQDLIAAGLI